MNGTLRSVRLPAVALLLLCALPSRVDAQQFVCWPIAAGDTASSLARKLTGKAAAAYGQAFQIRDPARQMFVPKSHYQRLQPDWQACVAPGPIWNAPIAYAPDVELASTTTTIPDEPAIAPTPPVALASAAPIVLAGANRSAFDLPYTTKVGATVVVMILLSAVTGLLARRPIPPVVRRAGEDFVTVFARPLLDASSATPPIRARLRYRHRRQQLEILIAPGPGHRYPNLADHRNNLEYDVDRVLGILGNHVLSKPPRAAGKWVVVTIASSEKLEVRS